MRERGEKSKVESQKVERRQIFPLFDLQLFDFVPIENPKSKIQKLLVLTIILPALAALGSARKPQEPQFKYVGGTEQIQQGCKGSLELTSEALTFRCMGGSVSAPYSSISLMQYRTSISREVLKMKLNWKVRPSGKRGKRNRYFTVLYNEGGAPRAIVLDVAPETMQPYLAEIDLKAGKRVEVQSHEEYGQ